MFSQIHPCKELLKSLNSQLFKNKAFILHLWVCSFVVELQVLEQTGAVANAATSSDIDVHSVCGLFERKSSNHQFSILVAIYFFKSRF